MELEEMKALVHRHDEDVVNRKDLSVLERDLAEGWATIDRLSIFRQLGVVPPGLAEQGE